jgi:hypothetical protein
MIARGATKLTATEYLPITVVVVKKAITEISAWLFITV